MILYTSGMDSPIDFVLFWDRGIRSWVLVMRDDEGNQLWGAQFYPNLAALKAQFLKC